MNQRDSDISHFRNAVEQSLRRYPLTACPGSGTSTAPNALGRDLYGSHAHDSSTGHLTTAPDRSERDDTWESPSRRSRRPLSSQQSSGCANKMSLSNILDATDTAGYGAHYDESGVGSLKSTEESQDSGLIPVSAASARVPPEIFSRVSVEQRIITLALMNVERLWKPHIFPGMDETEAKESDEPSHNDASLPAKEAAHVSGLWESLRTLLSESQPKSSEWWRSNVVELWTSIDTFIHEQGFHDYWEYLAEQETKTTMTKAGLQFFECRCAVDLVIELHQRLFSILLPIDAYISFWNQRIERPLMEFIEQGPFHFVLPFWLTYESPHSKVSYLREARAPLLDFLGKLRRALASFATAQHTDSTLEIARESLEWVKSSLTSEIPDSFRRSKRQSNENQLPLVASFLSFTKDDCSESSLMSTLDGMSESDSEEEEADNHQQATKPKWKANQVWSSPLESLSNRQRTAMLLKLREKADLYEDTVYERLQQFRPRGIFRRNWLKITLFSGVAVFSAQQFIHNREKLTEMVDKLKHAAKGFYNDHLKGPIDSMYNELFIRKESHVADVEAIKDAKRSLSSMLESFLTQRRQKGLVDIPRNAVAAAAQAMDMSHVSQAYEKEIRNPIYYFVAGDLVQMMLIQIQFIKKEMLNGMLAMDEIRKQQNLNMQLMALVPTILLAYMGGAVISNSIRRSLLFVARISSTGSAPSAMLQRWFNDDQLIDVGHARETLTPTEARKRIRLVIRDVDRLLQLSLMSQKDYRDRDRGRGRSFIRPARKPSATVGHPDKDQQRTDNTVDPIALAHQITQCRDKDLTPERREQSSYAIRLGPYESHPPENSPLFEGHLPGLSYEEVGELALLLHRLWSLAHRQKRSISLDEWIRLSQDVQELVNAVDGFSQQGSGEYHIYASYHNSSSRALELALAALKRIQTTYSFQAGIGFESPEGWFNQAIRKLL